LIARLSFVYGRHRSTEALTGFPAWVDQRLANGRETSLFTDQHVTPTRAGFAADLLLMPAYQRTDGVLNIACRSCVTPHEMGRIIAKEQGHDEQLLSQSRLRTLDRPAERPKYSCLATERLAELLEQPVPDIASELPLVL
jgi:dTDP-4-dehydrorhamnose reductase